MFLFLLSFLPGLICSELPPFRATKITITFEKIVPESAPSITSASSSSLGFAVDFGSPASSEQLRCIRECGYGVAFIRAYNPAGQGSFDANACQSVQNAAQAGLGIEVYMTPQPSSSKQGYQQLDEVYAGFQARGIQIKSIWVQVTSPKNWPKSAMVNVNFINNILARAKQLGLSAGIYTNHYDWNQITGSWTSVPPQTMLWYWNVLGGGVHAESPASFADFRPFGCWKTPSVKQFAQVEQLCQMTVNRNVYAANRFAMRHPASAAALNSTLVGGSIF